MPRNVVAVVLAAVAAIFLASAVPAFSAEGTKIAIVDFQRILQDSKKGKKAKAEWEAELEKRQRAFEKIKDEIRGLQQELESKGTLLSKEAKDQKDEELRRKIKDAERRASDYSEEIKRLDQKLTSGIVDQVKDIVKSYAKKNGIHLVFESTSANAVYASEGVDITDKIIAEYDKL